MTHVNCATCYRKVENDIKFVCCICNKTLHLTTGCTEFEKNTIEVLIKLNDNLIYICNSCEPNKQDFFVKFGIKVGNKNRRKYEKVSKRNKKSKEKTSGPNENPNR